jgi:cell division protein FtsZ
MEEETELEQTIELDLEEDEIIEEEAPTLNTLESTQVNTDTMKVEARERESRLRAISQQLRTPSGLTDLEDVPAYQRNNIELEEETHSSENEISTYTLSEGENNTTELKQNNSFLHDNVD